MGFLSTEETDAFDWKPTVIDHSVFTAQNKDISESVNTSGPDLQLKTRVRSKNILQMETSSCSLRVSFFLPDRPVYTRFHWDGNTLRSSKIQSKIIKAPAAD